MEFKVGQRVKNASGLVRTVIGIKGKKVTYKKGKKVGVCTVESLRSWKYR